MMKNVFTMTILISSLAIASGQPGYKEYQNIRGHKINYEERMSRNNMMVDVLVTDQSDYSDYKNIKGISTGNEDEMEIGPVTGQPGYTEYRYTQGEPSRIMTKD